MTVSVVSIGAKEVERYFEILPELTSVAARMAINDVARGKGLTLIKKKMSDEIAFPSGYLSGNRLKVTKTATNGNLEAVITARKRATSLARFASGSATPGVKSPGGVSVTVRRGRTTYLKNSFLVRLKSGASMSEDNYNVGLAVRLQPGERIANKKAGHKSWLVPGKVALLYAPSVDQVFRGVIGEVSGKIGDMLEYEFYRQFTRLTNG